MRKHHTCPACEGTTLENSPLRSCCRDMDQYWEPLLKLAKQIQTQDNRATDQPMFIVERKVKDWWVHPSEGQPSDRDLDSGTVWIQDGEEIDPFAEHFDKDRAYQCSFRERWEFVQPFFSEESAKQYIKIDGHNLGETRIYGWGTYRNNEFRLIRDFLLSLLPDNPPED